jgi:CRISPR/Cas system CMR subunit Cmr6 (Cas7 group RAMP superfamily)
MSSYETLLENYNLEEKYANDSFSNMMTCFESLNAFANENVNFEVVISLEEAESGKIKDNVTKIKEAAKRTAKAIEKKVSEFITKIKDALSRFVAKAKITIANKGNAALKKMLGNSELVIGKDIKLKYFKDGKSNAAIYKQVNKAIERLGNANFYYSSKYVKYMNDPKSIVDTLAEDVSKSNIVEDTVLKADENIKVKDAFAKYVDPLLKDTTDNLSNAQKTVNETIKDLKDSISGYKKKVKEAAKRDMNSTKAIYSEWVDNYREMISVLMKVSTRYINYVATVLVMGASNASKIALAAVDAKGKSVASKFNKK